MVLSGCKNSGPGPSAMVTPEAGGMVVSEDSRVKLMVPPGAVSSATTISIKPLALEKVPGDAFPKGVAYALEPDGTQFAMPVKVTLNFSADELAAVSPQEGLSVMEMKSVSGDAIEELDDVTFIPNGKSPSITGALSHFSWVYVAQLGVTVVLLPAKYHGHKGVSDNVGQLTMVDDKAKQRLVPIEVDQVSALSHAALDVTLPKLDLPLQFGECNSQDPLYKQFKCLAIDSIALKCNVDDLPEGETWGINAVLRKKTSKPKSETVKLVAGFSCSPAPDMAIAVDLSMSPPDMAKPVAGCTYTPMCIDCSSNKTACGDPKVTCLICDGSYCAPACDQDSECKKFASNATCYKGNTNRCTNCESCGYKGQACCYGGPTLDQAVCHSGTCVNKMCQ